MKDEDLPNHMRPKSATPRRKHLPKNNNPGMYIDHFKMSKQDVEA